MDFIDNHSGMRTLLKAAMTRDQLGDLPKAVPMIPGMIAQESTTVLFGRKDTYKSFVALDWALCLATGTPWRGTPVAMPEGRPHVMYMAAEGAYTFPPRVEAWEQHRGVKVGDNFILMNMAVNLFNGPLIGDFVKLVRDHPRWGVGLVVIDTLRRVSGGATENGSDMGVVIDNITRIRKATKGGAVLMLAHSDKNDKDIRGFSGLGDDLDILWHCTRIGPEKKGIRSIKLTNVRVKVGSSTPDIVMTPREVGVPSWPGTSLVMPTAGANLSVVPNATEDAPMRESDAAILAVLVDLFSEDGATAVEIKQAIKERRGGVEIPPSTFDKATKRLIEQGRLRRVGTRKTGFRWVAITVPGGSEPMRDQSREAPTVESSDLRIS